MYSVDTNIFVDWWERRYPPDVFPCVQKAMELLVSQDKLLAPERVLEEIIGNVGSKDLQNWAKQHKSIFVPHETDLQLEAQQILIDYPDLIDTTTPFDEADRWVIALAKINNFVVVTHETSVREKKNPLRKLYIPDVCRLLGIRCVEFLELMRMEGWNF